MNAGAKNVGLACLLLLALLVAGCGSSGDSGGPDVPYNPTWIYINTNNLPQATGTASVELRGKAYCDTCPPAETAFGYCPSYVPMLTSHVDVTWFNVTTGDGGPAVHAIVGSCSCFFSYCTVSYSHAWIVYFLPLTIGANDLRVIASYAGGTDEDSVIVTRVPQQVTGLAATAASGQVTLEWNSVPDAVSYTIYWSEDPDFTRTTAHVIPGAVSPYVHGGLNNDVTLYYLVTAVNGNFESATSAKVFATPGWPTTFLDETASNSEAREASLAVDSAQHIHVHYVFDECLAYATLDGFSYCSQQVRHSRYLTDQSGALAITQLPAISDVDANLVLSADESAHISYVGFGVMHGWLANGSWLSEAIDAEGWCGTSLAVDSSDHLHLAYFGAAAAGNEIRYAVQSAGSWSQPASVVLSPSHGCSVQMTGSIAVAAAATGAARIAYAGTWPDYGLYLARSESGAWLVETVDAGAVTNLDMKVDAAGLAYIASVRADGYLWLSRQDEYGVWTSATVNDERAMGQPSVVVDANGQVHIAYIGQSYLLRYATLSDGVWRVMLLDSNAQSGADLAVDAFGKVHIVYFKDGQLKYVSNR